MNWRWKKRNPKVRVENKIERRNECGLLYVLYGKYFSYRLHWARAVVNACFLSFSASSDSFGRQV